VKRRVPIKVPFHRSLLAFRLVLAGILVLSGWGFVSLTITTLHIQAEMPGNEHPYDYEATGCLLVILVTLMFYYLTRAERIQPKKWVKARSRRAWAGVRPGSLRAQRIMTISRSRPRRKKKPWIRRWG